MKPDLCRTMEGFHAFTGWDFIPSFARKGKIRPLAILEKKKEFQKAFASRGHDEKGSEIVIETLEKFVCFMYAKKTYHLSMSVAIMSSYLFLCKKKPLLHKRNSWKLFATI